MAVPSVRRRVVCGAFAFAAAVALPAHATTLKGKGYDWSLTDGGMAGVADGSSANVAVDENGYLHLKEMEIRAAGCSCQLAGAGQARGLWGALLGLLWLSRRRACFLAHLKRQ